MIEIISVPGDALFDVLSKDTAVFRDEYQDYYINIYTWNKLVYPKDVDDTKIGILIKKGDFMKLLLNRVFSCKEYTLKIELES